MIMARLYRAGDRHPPSHLAAQRYSVAGRSADPAHVWRIFRPAPRLPDRGVRCRNAGEQGVTKSVHVTAMWGNERALDETRWLQSVADKHGFPHGIVCQAEMTDPDLDAKLKAQKQFSKLRGVRHSCIGTAIRCASAVRCRTCATRRNSAAASRCWKNTACISNCRCSPAGEICSRADQGVSQRADDPAACRHAH